METSNDDKALLLLYDVDDGSTELVPSETLAAADASKLSSIPRVLSPKPTAYVVGTAKSAADIDRDEVRSPFHAQIEESLGISYLASQITVSGTGLKDLCLTWHNINAIAEGTKKKQKTKSAGKRYLPPKQILDNVSGVAHPGKLLAIMGASGAGKTTLLNVLTQRNLKGVTVGGTVKINGHEIGGAIRSISAYVQQEDLFIGTLKVREHLMFQALLRMGKSKTPEERSQRVDEVISELGLMKCAGTLIGIPGRVKGISGGEKKRLAFASEVLNNPPLMFCDEPTSGLDSFMAQQVVHVLRQMARRGKTVVCTIHQPSSQVFSYFDNLCLMAEGRVAFLGHPREAVQLFERVKKPCPLNFNPADHYIHSLAIVPGRENECKSFVKEVCDHFSKDAKPIPYANEARADPTSEWRVQFDEHTSGKSQYKATWFQQFRALMWRGFLATSREPLIVRVRLFQSIIIPLLLGLVYFQTELCCLTVQNVNGVLFLFVTNLTFPYVFGGISVFCEELPVFMREHLSAIYRCDVYYITKTLAELPQYLIFPIIFTTILYWMAGLRADAGTFLIALLVTILITNVAVSLGYLVSTMTGDMNMALTIAPVLVIPFMLFGGYFLNSASVPIYFIWLQYLSYFKYAYEAMVINEWRGVDSISECANQNSTVGCFHSGAEVLNMLNFKEDMLIVNIVVLFVMFLAIRLISFLFLLARTYRKN